MRKMAISTKALVIGLIIGLVIGGASSWFVKPKEIERVTETVLGPTETVTKTVSGPTVTVTKTATPTPTPTLTPTPSPSPSPSPTPSPTPVGGIIWENTTWTLENSPYIITETVQIPENVTLIIEPGVMIIGDVRTVGTNPMFKVAGRIIAKGTVDNRIIFDGGESYSGCSFFEARGDSFADLDYCIFKNGSSLWWGYGSLNLTHSDLINLYYSMLSRGIFYVEYNRFVNSWGLYIEDGSAYVNHNLFFRNRWSQITVAYSSKAIIQYNSFINTSGAILSLSYYMYTYLDATENYWGTTDTEVIDSMIHDMNDDIDCGGFVEYLPILTEPHPDTPNLSSTV